MASITAATVTDLRFPTSRTLDGSDAMNPDPDYSAAYLGLSTSEPELTGCGFVFTIGRGNDIQAAAVAAAADRLGGPQPRRVAGGSQRRQPRAQLGQPAALGWGPTRALCTWPWVRS